MAHTLPLLERAYSYIGDDSDTRACEAIPDEACTDVPRNFFLNVFNGASTKLAEQLASPGLVLPWLLSALGAPALIAGWLLPIRRGASMLPQMVVAGQIRSFARRKWFWVGAGITQSFALGGMVLSALLLSPVAAGWSILGLMVVFSIASGTGSVSFSDVVGKTIPRRRRGRLLGVRATLGGLLTLGAGIALRTQVKGTDGITPYLILVGGAAALWFLAALFWAGIREAPGATAGGRNAIAEAVAGWKLLRLRVGYGRYLASRLALVLGIEIAMPHYALHARRVLDGGAADLGVFVIMVGVSAAVSSGIWGVFSDRSSRTVLMVASLLGALTAGAALAIGALPEAYQTVWFYAPIFFLIGLSVAGVRMGRKTWIVDAAPDDERPTWVAFGNTITGVVTLAGGSLGLLTTLASIQLTLLTLGGLCLLGLVAAFAMPEAIDVRRSMQPEG